MNSAAPQIGFDRFIQLDLAASALRVRAGVSDIEQLTELIDATHAGAAAKKKTRTVPNRLWLQPTPDPADVAHRSLPPHPNPQPPPLPLSPWASAFNTLPFSGTFPT